MSVFTEKLRQGLIPSDEDWEKHLIEAHALEPRMTPEAFAAFTTDEGLNSYEILARRLPSPPLDLAILDLACGDGHLVPYLLARLGAGAKVYGIDISQDGIEAARAQIRDPRVSFSVARAQELPFENESMDFVFCHMAFMLMSPLAAVVNEIRRVLKPGGEFAFLFSAGAPAGVYKEIQRLAALFVQTHLPRLSEARQGSATVRDKDGLKTLFAGGFENEDMEVQEFHLRYHVPPEGVWDYMRNMYFVPMLAEHARREFKDDLSALARDHLDAGGKVLFHVPMKSFSVRKSV